jgi:hypothetical protein
MNFKYLIGLVLAILAQSCSPTFYKKHEKFNKLFANQEYKKAEAKLVEDKKSAKSKDRWIYYLNRGVIAHMLGKYYESNSYFEEAYKIHEDFIAKPIDEVLAFAFNPNIAEYHGEDHEALLVHYYKALNYLFLRDYESALVECRRLNIKLNLMADKYKDDSKKYCRDAFIHTLMGIIYQANKEYNNAFIAYRNAVDIYETDYKNLFSIITPLQLKKDLVFCAYMSEFYDQVKYFQDKFVMRDYDPSKEINLCDAVFLWHNGLGPIKDQWEINFIAIPGVAGGVIFKNDELGLYFPFRLSGSDDSSVLDLKLIRVVFPKYIERPLLYTEATLEIGEELNQQLGLVQSINAISFQVLKERMVWELSKSLMRVALKQVIQYKASQANAGLGLAVGVFNFITEDADTRNWQTLPYSIYYARLKALPGTHEVIFQASVNQTVSYKKDIICKFERNVTSFIEINTP